MSRTSPRSLLLVLALLAVGGAGGGGWIWWEARNRAAALSPGSAQQAFVDVAIPAPRALMTFSTPPDVFGLDAALPAPAHAVAYVRVDATLAAGPQSPFWQAPGKGHIEVPLPRGGSLVVVIERSERLGADRFVSRGAIEGRAGSRARFAWNEGFLHAEIEDPVLGTFALRAATDEFAQFYRIEPGLVLPCGGERLAPARAAAPAGPAREASWLPTTAAAGAENPQRAEVHLLMLHTPDVLPTLSGAARTAALQSAFDLAVMRVNDVLAASLVSARVRLVHVAETRYDETRSAANRVQDDALTALQAEADGHMDEIHALRDAVGADFVCLALARRDFASSGLSFVLGDIDDASNAPYAFSIVEYGAIAGTTVVAHELGHLFGCAHDRANAVGSAGAFPFSYGYRFTGTDGRQYRDIMAYPPGTELAFFSNPRLLAPGSAAAPLGIAAGQPGAADNALTIERTAFAAAAYRLQTQTPPAAGTLINVATRAVVGPGEAALIAGFVVNGPEPKPVLIRAAGPALRGFGVGDALADPVLRIVAGGAVIAENDQWSAPIGAGRTGAEIMAAAARAGAFPFAAASADAAVLLTLPPGAYSAVAEGARGATGSGLVEVFEIEAGAARIVNLATRAFADRGGREMIGGFVVRGEPGATKRILIRALGPTLGRAPFSLADVLDDPEMEVRNTAGELVLRSDDWSTGATGGASPANDFSPTVRTYGENQIAATGFAPPNRREPCVIADLPPGAYTVIVRPFELRDPDPAQDQPARPGVGLIEVYEIGR
ncbi:MAG: zinc-dependent metalloprotease family protein [Opitutaceae bacterium]|nr:zinc-dependent metalloprotease family protein [Opitutaceae bacterium]